ncbi:FadR family transcriptional regulator [Thermomicrobiaceae bacterium CFH 74404]|uniref:FadR family transcriptional regulator n=1 Tax=Thermalbibacter longus TaxID=2951981 RepID=A0AA41WFN0_9BACT|nr:FadR/GntR family transcriptional regulator [Thermalbibacter longus]MCM8750203.1 FadR family transcriptional regulator [Thermalbibacter longus]
MNDSQSGTYRPVNQARLHEGVVQQITQQIVSGALQPGMALPTEPELARQFGVSRTVIREAVRVLASKGLITVRHGSGMWVQPPDAWDHLDPLILFERVRSGQDVDWLDEVLELRKVLELAAAELAAKRRTPADLEAMEAELRAMRGLVHDPAVFAQHDVAFHEAIMAAARNRLLREARRPLSQVLFSGWRLTGRTPERVRRSLEGHEAIYAAIAQGDPDQAREAMRRHLEQFEKNIREDLLPRYLTAREGASSELREA